MLTKDLRRISRSGGGYQPEFVGESHRPLAVRVLDIYQGHVGEPRRTLSAALDELETTETDFKLVRGLAKLVERETSFETRAPVDPVVARRTAFEAAETVAVANDDERDEALSHAATTLGTTADEVATSLYADREERQYLVETPARYTPDTLLSQYNLSLAQTALFDATEVRIRSSDPRRLVSAVKRLGLMYEVRRTDDGRELLVTGPDALFRATRRYGTGFARLLRTVVGTAEWHLVATVDDRGTDRELRLSHEDPLREPDADPIVEPSYDSAVESDFAGRFSALGLDWELAREPEPLETGARVMIPDFAFDYRFADFRLYFEIVGFWTPEYVAKKLHQLAHVEDVELLVAVDESLGVGEQIQAQDHRVVPYSGSVSVKDVVDVLRHYEVELVAETGDSVPAEVVPDADVITLASVADRYGVSEAVLEDRAYPEHECVGRTLVRPTVLSAVRAQLDEGMTFAEAASVLADCGIEDASATLSALGYVVEWDGLAGGVLRSKE